MSCGVCVCVCVTHHLFFSPMRIRCTEAEAAAGDALAAAIEEVGPTASAVRVTACVQRGAGARRVRLCGGQVNVQLTVSSTNSKFN